MIDDVESVSIKEFEVPNLKSQEVLIRVKMAGICGSDIHTYKGLHSFRKPPVVIGHEVSGNIEAIGEGVTEFNIGDKVTVVPQSGCGNCEYCQRKLENYCITRGAPGIGDWLGTTAEYCVVPASAILKLPDSMDHKIGVLTEPLAVGFHAVKKAEIKATDRIIIIGAGPIGLLTLAAAIEQGAKEILITDVLQYPLEVANELGAAESLNISQSSDWKEEAIKKMDGHFDKVLVTAGVSNILNDSIQLAKKGGKIVTVAMFHDEQKIDIVNLQGTEKEIIGCMTYNRSDFDDAIKALTDLNIPMDKIISHVLPYEEASKGFRIVDKKEENSIKVLLTF